MNDSRSSYRVSADAPDAATATAAALERGEVVVVPTDTVYGLAALSSVEGALDRVFELKRRPPERTVAVLVADVDQAATIVSFSPAARALAGEHWPGALTLVLPSLDHVDYIPTAPDGTIGVRCPASPLMRAIARQVGPLTTTSANVHGQPTPTTLDAVLSQLGAGVAVAVDGGLIEGSASTVARVGAGGIEVLRPGPVIIDSP